MQEEAVKETKDMVTNSQVRDSGGKIIFDDPMLCAQFCRGFVDLPYMKDVQPEDIEDVSAQFVPLIAEERNADRVKKINIKGKSPFFLISLIEHKTKTEYNIGMQIFRYMIYIWEDYAKEEEKRQKGISKTKDFKYPMILPIVYYEGSEESWTAPRHFKDRIAFGDVFKDYAVDFQYYLVPIRKYSNEELLQNGDEMSLLMLINKVQSKEDIEELRNLPIQRMEEILKENVPMNEAEELVEKVREKKMGELFENMEKLDIQAERRNTAAQRERADREKERADKAEERADKERERGIRLYLDTCRECGVSGEIIIGKLQELYEMSLQEAEALLKEDNYFVK